MHELRIKCTGRPAAGLQAAVGTAPAAIWDSDDLELRVWLGAGARTAGVADPFDLDTIATLTLEMRETDDTSAMLISAKAVTDFTACTLAEFVAGDGQHATFEFSDTDTNTVGTLDQAWISIVATLTDGSRYTFAAGYVAIVHSGADQSAVVDSVDTYAQNAFKTIAISGQSSVVADSPTDTLTLVGGTGITLTTNATTDTITITASAGSGTVTSVNASGGTTGLTFSGGPVTASGTLTLAGTLAVANGGTGSTTAADARTALGVAATSHTHAQSDVTGLVAALAAKTPNALVSIISDTGTVTAYNPASDSNVERGYAIRSAVAAAVSGDTIRVGAGIYDIEDNVLELADNVNLSMDPGTVIDSIAPLATFGCIVVPGANSVISGGTIRCAVGVVAYQACIGINNETNHSAKTGIRINGVRMIGDSDAFYVAASDGVVEAVLTDCVLETKFDAAFIKDDFTAGGNLAHKIDLYNPRIIITGPNGAGTGQARGLTSNDGSTIRVFGGSIKVTDGGATTNTCAEANDGGTIELYGVKTYVSNGANPKHDLKNVSGTIRVAGGSGSGTAGAWITSGTITNVDGNAGSYIVNGGDLGTPSSGTIGMTAVTLSGTMAQFDTACSNGNFVYSGTAPTLTATNFTGTASININGTVGATTPSTVAATTGAFSGAVTMTAGTASTSTTTGNLVITGGLGVSGSIYAGSLVSSNNFRTGSGGSLYFHTNSSTISAPTNGQIQLTDAAGTSFTRINLGLPTSSFPAIKRNGTAINFRLADDSADCAIAASAGTFSTTLAVAGATTLTGKATMNGGRQSAYVSKTGTYTIVAATDYCINCTSGTFTVTLPTAASIAGQEFIIKNSGGGTITLATTSSQTIDGATTQTLATYTSICVMSDGTNWIITANYITPP